MNNENNKVNPLFEQIVKERNGRYCHCIEVNDVYDLENVAEAIIEEHSDQYRGNHTEDTIIDFLSTLEVYCLDDANGTEVYAFSFDEFIRGTI